MIADNAAERDERNKLIAELQESSFTAVKANNNAQIKLDRLENEKADALLD
jgi:hypothetical protein